MRAFRSAIRSVTSVCFIEAAYETGITFIDTADVYNGGNSEKAIGKLLSKYPEHFYVVTKCGRALKPHTDEMYTPEAVEGFVDGSLSRLGLEKLDNILPPFDDGILTKNNHRVMLMME